MNGVPSGELGDPAPSEAFVPAVITACRILDALAARRSGGATLSELARVLGLSKSTMHGQLATLSAHGLIERDEVTRRFRLGPALVALGTAAARPNDLAALAAERLPVLAGEHRLTFALALVESAGQARLTERAYPLRDVHVGLALGNRYGIGDGAIGKCLLAAMLPDDATRAVRERPLARHTERTILAPEALLAEAELVRSRGWASSAGELKPNHAVAVPLHDSAGDLRLVLCAVSFPSDLPEADFPAIGDALKEAAAAIEAAASGIPALSLSTTSPQRQEAT